MQDPDIVVDLRNHNPDRPSKYEPFWECVDTYLYEVAETAVHDRRHERISYVAAAL